MIFRIFFKEKVSCIQLSGMILMFGCIIILGISTSQQPEESLDGINKQYYAFISIMFSFLSPLFLSIKHIFIRSYKKQYDSWDMAIDGLIFEY